MDAVFHWDFGKDGENTVYTNIEVGLLPKGAFTQLGGTPADSEKWQAWSRQWTNSHGGGDYAGWMLPSDKPDKSGFPAGFGPWSNTPERLVAGWLSNGKIPAADREAVLQRLNQRLHDFSTRRVETLMKEHMKAKGTP
jgi:hypothetical protein